MPFAWWELVLILLVLLLVFGAKRLPEMGRSLGKGMREFKDSVSGMDDKDDRDDRDDRPSTAAELPAAPSEPTLAEPDRVPAEKTERETVS
jgi:sec-independent protein translocase protein TatA